MGLMQRLRNLRSVRFDEPVVVLDLETTGLNPRTDRILAIAAVPVADRRILLHQRYVRLIRDSGPVNPEAIRHHRLRPLDVRDGGEVIDVLPELIAWIDGRPVVGYATRFDLAFLKQAARGLHLQLPGRHADVRDLVRRRTLMQDPNGQPALRFEQIANDLNLPVIGRHEALGDAVTTALIWIALAEQSRR